MQKCPTIVLVDGNSFLYRMFHTKTPRSHEGQRIESAVAMLRDVESISTNPALKGLGDILTIVVNDAPGKSWRHEFYTDYKHSRTGMPPELKSQECLAHDLLSASGIPTVEQSGLEADDIIGILAKHYASQGSQVIMWANDKDLYQLIDADIKLYNPDTKKIIDEAGTFEKFGVTPQQIPDLLALMGDDKDCIPGIPSCGIKTAAKWLNTYGNVAEIIAHANDVKGLASENLRIHKDLLHSSLTLTTIVTDLNRLDTSILECIDTQKVDHSRLSELYKQCGMSYSSPYAKTSKNTNQELAVAKPADPFEQGMLF